MLPHRALQVVLVKQAIRTTRTLKGPFDTIKILSLIFRILTQCRLFESPTNDHSMQR